MGTIMNRYGVHACVCMNKAMFYRQMLPGDDSNILSLILILCLGLRR